MTCPLPPLPRRWVGVLIRPGVISILSSPPSSVSLGQTTVYPAQDSQHNNSSPNKHADATTVIPPHPSVLPSSCHAIRSVPPPLLPSVPSRHGTSISRVTSRSRVRLVSNPGASRYSFLFQASPGSQLTPSHATHRVKKVKPQSHLLHPLITHRTDREQKRTNVGSRVTGPSKDQSPMVSSRTSTCQTLSCVLQLSSPSPLRES